VCDQNVIRAEGVVIEVRSERLYRVELANGHRFLGFVTARRAAAGMRLAVGDRVAVEMSPLDLSKGRIQAKL
jgi:translation initiation factor IF-1